jgi:hypothetical protein
MYKKAMIQNLEFIADSEAFKKISDKKAYQITSKLQHKSIVLLLRIPLSIINQKTNRYVKQKSIPPKKMHGSIQLFYQRL